MIENIEMKTIVKVFEKHGVNLVEQDGSYLYYDDEEKHYKFIFVDAEKPIEGICKFLNISEDVFNQNVTEIERETVV